MKYSIAVCRKPGEESLDIKFSEQETVYRVDADCPNVVLEYSEDQKLIGVHVQLPVGTEFEDDPNYSMYILFKDEDASVSYSKILNTNVVVDYAEDGSVLGVDLHALNSFLRAGR